LIAAGTRAATFGSAVVLELVEVEVEVEVVPAFVERPDAGVLLVVADVLLLLLLPQPAITTTPTSGIKLFQVRM